MDSQYWNHLDNLVVVACHAVYVADSFQEPLADSSWRLLSYQNGEPPLYLEHIRRGVEIAGLDRTSLLVFSGGQTRRAAGPRSEAQSYWILAEHNRWWGSKAVRCRATTEEFARDSFENLLFSICRFRECVGSFPERITAISFSFKAERFDLHRAALRFPREKFSFEGLNNPPNLEAAVRREQRNARDLFAVDPYGCHGQLLRKRRIRNPFNRESGYLSSCPEVARLLVHRGPALYQDDLPWDQ